MKKLKLALLTFLFSISVSHAFTLSQALTEERLRIKDTNTAHQRYTDTQLTNLTNEAVRDIINNTWALEKISTFTTVSGTTYYAFPSDMLAISRVTSAGQVLPEKTLISLDADAGGSNWQSTSGAPQAYFVDQGQPNKIGFYPFPNNTTSTTSIVINYYASPVVLSATTDVLFSGDTRLQQYVDIVVFYVAYRVYLIEGETDKATLYRQEYESRLLVMEAVSSNKPNYNPGMAGSGKGR